MPADTTLDTFFNILDPSNADYKKLNDLMDNVFCPNTGTLPWVGISKYGPQFQGGPAVRALFQQLFNTFPNACLAEVAPRFYCPGDGTPPTGIAVQTTLSGTQKAFWFQTAPAYSAPLSNITPDGKHSMSVDACAVVFFDVNDKITQLSLYFDRYSLSQQLTLPQQHLTLTAARSEASAG